MTTSYTDWLKKMLDDIILSGSDRLLEEGEEMTLDLGNESVTLSKESGHIVVRPKSEDLDEFVYIPRRLK
ncbi:hypothetical protein EU538_09040 [Candidatus Thorarchaeota archaeon]|nr:MAG: hypothetical protein EU538_09040 [Candidatus Thorarchaeota archaeon]